MKYFSRLLIAVVIMLSGIFAFRVIYKSYRSTSNKQMIVGNWKDTTQSRHYLCFTKDGYQEIVIKNENEVETFSGNYTLNGNKLRLDRKEYLVITLNEKELRYAQKTKEWVYQKIDHEEW